MMFKLVLLASMACAAPLPYGISTQRKWIKINEIEHEVPPHLSPEQFRQQMSTATPVMHIPSYPVRPAPVYTNWNRQQINPAPYTVQTVPMGTGSFHVGFQPQPTAIPVSRPVPALVRPAPIIPSYASSVFQGYPQPVTPQIRFPLMNAGTRQWVKLMEGTTPIEVPAGRDPQEFLQSIKLGGTRRFLSGKHSAPIVTKMTTTYEVLPIPQPAPSKKGYMPRFAPPPPMKGKLIVPSPKGKMAPPPVFAKGKGGYVRPMYVAARPISKW